MAGQGDTGAAEQSSRHPPSADSYAAAAKAAAAAAMRLISAHIRVGHFHGATERFDWFIVSQQGDSP